jgi:hypothetical protein
MKKNGYLLLIFVGLLAIAFVFEEWRPAKKREQELRARLILAPEISAQLETIALPHTLMKKENGRFWCQDPHYPVDPEKEKQMLVILKNLEMDREINVSEIQSQPLQNFFPENTLRFSITAAGKIYQYLMGKKLDFDQKFYLSVESEGVKKWAVAEDPSPAEGFYVPEDAHRSAVRYERLRNMILARPQIFLDHRLFKEITPVNLDRLSSMKIIQGKLQLAVNFGQGKEVPAAMQEWREKLRAVRASYVYYPVVAKNLKEKISSLELLFQDGQKVSMKLFRFYGSLEGLFLQTTFDPLLYELGEETYQLFMVTGEHLGKPPPPPSGDTH